MPQSKNLKMLPMTIPNFVFAYSLEALTKLQKITEYRKYLSTNVKVHHYGWAEDLHNWFEYELNLMKGN